RGVRSSLWSSSPMPTWPSPRSERLGTPRPLDARASVSPDFGLMQINSRNPLHAGHVFRGFPIHLRYGLPGCSPPFDGSNQVSPAPEGFYFQAFGSLVTLPAAGYHYNMDWTPCVGGTCTRWNGS